MVKDDDGIEYGGRRWVLCRVAFYERLELE
jgi:hypothetical protein